MPALALQNRSMTLQPTCRGRSADLDFSKANAAMQTCLSLGFRSALQSRGQAQAIRFAVGNPCGRGRLLEL